MDFNHFNHWGYMHLLVVHLLALSRSLSLPILTLCWTSTEHSIPATCLKRSTDKVRGQPEEEQGEKRGRGWPWLAGSVLYVSAEVPLYAPVFAFKGPAHFSHREEGRPEGERCFSFSELPGLVCAPTRMVSWVIKPSRWLFELFEPGQYWVTRLL